MLGEIGNPIKECIGFIVKQVKEVFPEDSKKRLYGLRDFTKVIEEIIG